MRKHFLILMLMALLPLAGWAQTATLGEVAVGEYTYGTADLPIPVVKDSEGAILNPTDHYNVSTKAYKEATCETEVAVPDMKGDQNYYLKITGKGAYVGQEKSVYFTVKKKALTVTVATSFQRNYQSEIEPEIQTADVTIAGYATGTGFNETTEKAKVTGTLDYTYDGKGNAQQNGGQYDITFSGLSSDYYTFNYPTQKFTINGINVLSSEISIKEGTAFAEKTYKGAAFTAADLTGLVLEYTATGTTTKVELTQGTDFDVALRYSFSSYGEQDMTTHYTNGVVEVVSQEGDAAIVKVISNPGYTTFEGKIYKVTGANGTTAVQLMGDGSGNEFTTPSNIWVTVTEDFLNVGTYNYTVNFKRNYAGTLANFGTFKIKKAPLSVGVDDITVTYKGDAYTNSFGTTPKFNYYGFVGKDAAIKDQLAQVYNSTSAPQGILKTAPTVAVKSGVTAKNIGEDYELAISGGETVAGSNYEIKNHLTNGRLHIKKYELVLKAKDAEKAPGATDPTFKLDTYTLANANHSLSGVTFTRVAGETIGESYEITPVTTNATIKDGSTPVISNYEIKISTTKGKLTIKKADLVITILDQDKFYGDADPATIAAPENNKNYIVTGLVKGDQITSLNLVKSWADDSDAGNYILDAEVTYTGADHYASFTIVPGNFKIKKAPLTATMTIQNVDADQSIADATTQLKKQGITITGFKKNETVANTYDLTLNSAVLTTNTLDKLDNQSKANGYILTLKSDFAKNYGFGATLDAAIYGKVIVGTGSGIALDLTTENAVAANIATLEAENANVNMPDQPLNAKEWYAVVLPFKTTPAELVAHLNTYVVVDKIKNSTINAAGVVTVNFEMEWDEIPAGEPFLIKPAQNTNWNRNSFVNKLIVKNITTKETDNATFTGTYATGQSLLWGKDLDGTTDKEGAAYRWLAHKEYKGDNNWKNPKNTAHTLTPLEAYLVLDSNATGARVFVEDFENGTTAIKELGVDGTNKAYSVDGWYTLNGVKLQGAPTEKGVYINNGKKIVIK